MCKLLYIILIQISVASMQSETTDNKKSQRETSIPVWSRGIDTNSANVTVYLGYANNPFGPSIRFQHKKGNVSKEKSIKNYVDTGQSEGRTKRGVVHLYNMVSCATGCNPLAYKGYGCYCGFLGSGYAVDGIDRCCKKHDWCYDTSNCPTFLIYFVPYYWQCYNNKPLCALEHGEWGGVGSCAQKLCECDRKLSECLRRYPCPSTRALCRSSPLRLLQNAFMIF